MIDWQSVSWAERELSAMLVALARAAGLDPRAVTARSQELPARLDERVVSEWLRATAEVANVDIEPIDCNCAQLAATLSAMHPGIVRIRLQAERRYLAVVHAGPHKLSVLTRSLASVSVPVSALRQLLLKDIEKKPRERVDYWLTCAGIEGYRARRAQSALLSQLLAERRIGDMWLLRADPGSSFTRQLGARGAGKRLTWFVLASLAQIAITMYGWTLIGKSALSGVAERDWLLAWMLACLSAIPLQAAVAWCGGRLLVDVAALLKQRLLCGALRLPADNIRERGSGRLLAMVSESEAIEGPGLNGAVAAVLACVQLLAAAGTLYLGAGGALHVLLLAAWSACVLALVQRFYRARDRWTDQRLSLSRTFVEQVLGNRTRIAQQPEPRWHELEDQHMQAFLASSQRMDLSHQQLSVLAARGWFLLGFLGLLPALFSPELSSAQLAVGIGGILQAYYAFGPLSVSATLLASAFISCKHVGDLYHAAKLRTPPANATCLVDTSLQKRTLQPGELVLDVRGLSYRYPQGAEPVLRQCALTLRVGDRLLLEGPSGGGKSTLAALLLGLRTPDAGHILLRGLDRQTLGSSAWRRRIASAPQFHDNHILSASLAFNLLMGRAWPPSPEDLREAEALCVQLGLGPMLTRMPARLNQVVGETGWQLSHGERSRVFLARALLQHAEVVVLDETFGALDPHTLRTCVDVVFARAAVLLVIAHP